jgi:hypothetical protein
MKIHYVHKRFRAASQVLIEKAISIIEEYTKIGYDLTLRQLYYQMVARAIIENSVKSYKRLGGLISGARLAGLIDWDAIIDRTRTLRGTSHWDDPRGILRSAEYSFHYDKWIDQAVRFEVWVEKDALIGVISRICNEFDVDYFACRGYVSQSAMWRAAQRLGHYSLGHNHQDDIPQRPIILHLGDHDPSGIDMTRDIIDRLGIFELGYPDDDYEVRRIALNRDQIDQFKPPPNPTKLTDSRADGYVQEHGYNSWELDALDPRVITELIRSEIERERDDALWFAQLEREKLTKAKLRRLHVHYSEIAAFAESL